MTLGRILGVFGAVVGCTVVCVARPKTVPLSSKVTGVSPASTVFDSVKPKASKRWTLS